MRAPYSAPSLSSLHLLPSLLNTYWPAGACAFYESVALASLTGPRRTLISRRRATSQAGHEANKQARPQGSAMIAERLRLLFVAGAAESSSSCLSVRAKLLGDLSAICASPLHVSRPAAALVRV